MLRLSPVRHLDIRKTSNHLHIRKTSNPPPLALPMGGEILILAGQAASAAFLIYGASLVFGQFFAGERETQPLPPHSEAMTA